MSKPIITVFGATGSQGGSVARELSRTGRYHIRAVTRNANSDKAKKLLELNDVSVVEANLDQPATVDEVLKNAYGVFLVTDFSAHMEHKETQQGVNAIDSAIRNNLKHFVFSGLEDVKSLIGKPCYHFDYKAAIEDYGLKQADKIIFTSIRLPFYFENFESTTLHKVGDKQYVLTAPMEGKQLLAVSVDDTGAFVVDAFNNPEKYRSFIVNVAAENLTIAEYAEILNKHLAPNHFADSQATVKSFAALGFPGAEELAIMFEYFQSGKMFRDIALSKSINKNLHSFEDWVIKNKDLLLKHFQ